MSTSLKQCFTEVVYKPNKLLFCLAGRLVCMVGGVCGSADYASDHGYHADALDTKMDAIYVDEWDAEMGATYGEALDEVADELHQLRIELVN